MSQPASHETDNPDDGDLIRAILAVPSYREQFEDALARTQAAPGTRDDPREIERRLQLMLK